MFLVTGLKHKLLLIIFLSAPFWAGSQSWEWARSAGGSYSDKGIDMGTDTFGNVYVCGYFNYQASFGTINSNAGFGKQGFLAKIDSNGTWQWMMECDGGWDERVLGMCVDTIN